MNVRPLPKSKVHTQVRGDTGSALRLLQIEAEARRCESAGELMHHAVNETRTVVEFRQAIVFRRKHGSLRVAAVSSLSAFDRQSPLIQAAERVIRAKSAEGALDAVTMFAAPEAEKEAFVFQQAMWSPLKTRNGAVVGGILFLRERPWHDAQKALASRISDTYSHALSALTRDRGQGKGLPFKRVLTLAALAGVAAACFIPVPLTTIAPVEIVGRNPDVVAAPLNGVIAELAVSPNEFVRPGDVLMRLEDTELRNAADIAGQTVQVARARLAATSSSAFGSADARRDLAIAEAELELAQAEKSLADERLALTTILAPTAGLVIFDGADDWTGRPVSVGERILEIADPEVVEYQITLPVDDLIILKGDEKARVFLDSDPLRVRTAEITRTSFHAVEQPDGALAYELHALDTDPDGQILRIGARGTAQVLGQDAPLWFVVFRRPLAWMRQTFGV